MKLFTDDELKEMGQRTLDLILKALEENDIEAAKKLSKRMYREFSGMHDLLIDWITGLQSYIGKSFGEDALDDAMIKTVTEGFSRIIGPAYANADTRAKVFLLMFGLRGHLGSFKVMEDDEKITILVDDCPSGGRLVKSKSYEGDDGYFKVSNKIGFKKQDFPVYCTHCFYQNAVAAMPGGEPLFLTKASDKPGIVPCSIYIYKKPSEKGMKRNQT